MPALGRELLQRRFPIHNHVGAGERNDFHLRSDLSS